MKVKLVACEMNSVNCGPVYHNVVMGFEKIGLLFIIIAVVSASDFESVELTDNEVGSDENDIQQESNNVCQTEVCKVIGHLLQGSMNKSVDPCDNFYDFVCGRWTHAPGMIPAYQSRWGIEDTFQDTIYKFIREILKQPPKPSDILPVRQAKKWYGACMNSKVRRMRGIKPIEFIIMQTGGWPMIMDPEEWSEDDFTWQHLDKSYLYATGELSFYNIETTLKEYDDGFFNEIQISDSSLPLTDKLPSTFRDTATESEWTYYKSLITKIVNVFVKHTKADVTKGMITEDVEALVEFEKELHKIKNIDDSNVLTTVASFIADYRTNLTDIQKDTLIDFKHLFKVLYDMINIKIYDDSDINVINPGYYVALTKLLSETSQRTIANYMHWKFVSMAMFYTTDQMQDIFNEEMEDVTAIEEKPPRWLECVQNLKLKHAVSYAYATEYFTKNVEKTGLAMVENIRREIFAQIEASNWLNSDGKIAMMNKLNNMKVFLGFPDWYKNETAVRASYKGLKVGYDYFENMINFNKYNLRKKLQLKEGDSRNDPWTMEATEVNALYDQDINAITIPAAHFLPKLLIPDMPESVKYGYLGFTIGHEMGHAFDNDDINYDVDLGYNMKLSEPMLKNYFQLAECFLAQFNNYSSVTEPIYEGTTPGYGEGSAGRRTRSENMADTTGLQAVFKAWKKVNLKRHEQEPKLPGFEKFTDDQMFFIGFAMTWCTAMTPEYKEYMESAVHSLPHLRVIGAVSNTEDFAKVFQCPKGSTMNPDNKCNIWKAADEIQRRRRSHKSKSHGRRRSIVKG